MKRKAFSSILIVTSLILSMFGLIINTSTAGSVRRVPQDYPTIQKAINAAASGDTILVDTGTYPEYVCVNKSVTLQGTNRESIITGGSGSTTRVVDVKIGTMSFSGNVKISGFTVQGPTVTYKGIYVYGPTTYFSNINISDNTVIGCSDAIFYGKCKDSCILNNTCKGNVYGIRLYDSYSNVVDQNFVNASSYYGIHFYARSHHNNMTKNIVAYTQYGVHLEYANYTWMNLNKIENNTEYGIRLSYTFYSTFKGNNIAYNKIGVYIWNCSNNQFYYNNFIENTNQVTHYNALLTGNLWDDNPPPPHIPGGAKGNYWSDYTGVDDGSGVGRWGEGRLTSDGIGDTKIPHLSLDWYPLMHPWPAPPGPNPVAIFTWSPPVPIYNQITTFNASESYDINGTIVLYKWNFGDSTPLVEEPDPIATHVFPTWGNFTVTLTVRDNDGLENSTSHLVRVLEYKLEIDVFTQQEPYSGKGLNQPSDAFAPQSEVILYANVTYNYEPVENKEVVFVVNYPDGTQYLYRTDYTDENGTASVNFTLATDAPFGNYTVLAQVTVSEHLANDTLTFEVGWIIEILKVETVDQNGVPKTLFAKGEQIYFSIDLKNIAFTSRNVTLTVGMLDETSQAIGAADLRLTVPPGTHAYGLAFSLLIPQWTLVGSASAHANAYTKSPSSGGVPYCPEKSTSFMIKAG